jgi:hypothetical protein
MTDEYSHFGQSLFGFLSPPLATSEITAGTKTSKLTIPIRFPIPGESSRLTPESCGPTTRIQNTFSAPAAVTSSSSSSSSSSSLLTDVALDDVSRQHATSWTNLFGTSLKETSTVENAKFPVLSGILDEKALQIRTQMSDGGHMSLSHFRSEIDTKGDLSLDLNLNLNEMAEDTDTHAQLEFPPSSVAETGISSDPVLTDMQSDQGYLQTSELLSRSIIGGRKRRRDELPRKDESLVNLENTKMDSINASQLVEKKTLSSSSSSLKVLSTKKKTKNHTSTQMKTQLQIHEPMNTHDNSTCIDKDTSDDINRVKKPVNPTATTSTTTKKKKKKATPRVLSTKPTSSHQSSSTAQKNSALISTQMSISMSIPEPQALEERSNVEARELVLEPRSDTLRVLLQHIYDRENHAASLRSMFTTSPSLVSSIYRQARIKWKSAMDLFLSELRKPQDHLCSLLVFLLHLQGSSSNTLSDCVVIAFQRDHELITDNNDNKTSISSQKSILNLAIVKKSSYNVLKNDQSRTTTTTTTMTTTVKPTHTFAEIILPLNLSIGFFGSDANLWPENVKRIDINGTSSVLLRSFVLDDANLDIILPQMVKTTRREAEDSCKVLYDFFPLSAKIDPLSESCLSISLTFSPIVSTSLSNVSMSSSSEIVPSIVQSFGQPRDNVVLADTDSIHVAPNKANVSHIHPEIPPPPPTFLSSSSSPPPPPPSSSNSLLLPSSFLPLPSTQVETVIKSASREPTFTISSATSSHHLLRSTSSSLRQQSINHSSFRQQSIGHPIMVTIAEAETIASRAASNSALFVHSEHIRLSLLTAAQFLCDDSGVKLTSTQLSSIAKDIADKAVKELKGAMDEAVSISSSVAVEQGREVIAPSIGPDTAIIRRRISPELISTL